MSATHIFYPMPRRPANLELSQQPSTPMLSPNISNGIPSRTHSALNLSSSTLLGIFSPSYFDPDQESPSLMGSPPSHQNQISRNVLDKISYQSQPLQKTKLFNFFLRVLLLFATGMGFGFLIQHLLDEKQPSSILFKIISDRKIEWIYLLSWGMSGVTIGTLLPLMDQPPSIDKHISQGSVISSVSTANKETSSKQFDILDQDWTPIIRSVGAFVGITYALVCIPCPPLTNSQIYILTWNKAQVVMDLKLPGIISPYYCESCPLVSFWSLETRLLALNTRWFFWNCPLTPSKVKIYRDPYWSNSSDHKKFQLTTG